MRNEDGGDCTILDEDGQALLDEQGGVENNEPKAQRQDIVAGAHFEKGADCALFGGMRISLPAHYGIYI